MTDEHQCQVFREGFHASENELSASAHLPGIIDEGLEEFRSLAVVGLERILWVDLQLAYDRFSEVLLSPVDLRLLLAQRLHLGRLQRRSRP